MASALLLAGGTCRTHVRDEPALLYTAESSPTPLPTPIPAGFLKPPYQQDLERAEWITSRAEALQRTGKLDEALLEYKRAAELFRLVERLHPEVAQTARYQAWQLDEKVRIIVEERTKAEIRRAQGAP